MCGIVGCLSESDVAAFLISGLRKLEYRGYDSSGLALIERGELLIMRRRGKLDELATEVDKRKPAGRVGIGHTRWATHGRPSEQNAHPHTDCEGKIVVVHNGIIENYSSLKKELIERGHTFTSQTDSEVLAHLIEKYFEGDLTAALRRSLADVEGAYALVAIHLDQPDRIVCARKDSPLVVGVSEKEMYVASDIPALLEKTRHVVVLEDGDLATLTFGSVAVTDLDGKAIARETQKIDWDPVMIQKGGYRHFMLKEIDEQPVVASNNIAGRLDDDGAEIFFEDLCDLDGLLDQLSGITILACGTSWHAGLVGKFMIESMARVPVEVDYSSEFRYRDTLVGSDRLVLAISQSGETADTLAALREAKSKGARSLAICNVISSTLCREAGGVILNKAGPEIGVASTKAFTSQLVALLLFAFHLGRKTGTLSDKDARGLMAEIRRLPHSLETALRRKEELEKVAQRFWRAEDFLFIGRGINFPIALEGALKLKEISYIHAEGYPAGEMKHGPIALIDHDIPVVAIASRSRVYDKILSNVEEVKARDGKVIAVVNAGDERMAALADEIIEVPAMSEVLSPIVNVIPLQILAYYVARRRGCDIDQPRNLAKSVTVE